MVRFIFRCESGEDAVKYKKYLERAVIGNRDTTIRLAWGTGIDAFPGVVMDVEPRFTLADDIPTELCLYHTINIHHWEIEELPSIAE